MIFSHPQYKELRNTLAAYDYAFCYIGINDSDSDPGWKFLPWYHWLFCWDVYGIKNRVWDGLGHSNRWKIQVPMKYVCIIKLSWCHVFWWMISDISIICIHGYCLYVLAIRSSNSIHWSSISISSWLVIWSPRSSDFIANSPLTWRRNHLSHKFENCVPSWVFPKTVVPPNHEF